MSGGEGKKKVFPEWMGEKGGKREAGVLYLNGLGGRNSSAYKSHTGRGGRLRAGRKEERSGV